MLNKKGDIGNFLGAAFIIVLFVLLFSAFSDTPVKETIATYQFELRSDYHSDKAKDILADAVQLPSLQKSCLSLSNNPFNENYKISADNRKISQSYILLQKIQLSVKPVTAFRFYYHLFPNEAEDPPVLS